MSLDDPDNQECELDGSSYYTNIPILGPLSKLLSVLLQSHQRLICPRHGAISRIALVCVHVAEHNALIEGIEDFQKRPHFDQGFQIEIVTCKRSDHSSDEFVVVCEECASEKNIGPPEWN
jgi:hypothetical protein